MKIYSYALVLFCIKAVNSHLTQNYLNNTLHKHTSTEIFPALKSITMHTSHSLFSSLSHSLSLSLSLSSLSLYFLSPSLSLSHTHTLSVSLSLSHTHTHTLSLSFTHSLTHSLSPPPSLLTFFICLLHNLCKHPQLQFRAMQVSRVSCLWFPSWVGSIV